MSSKIVKIELWDKRAERAYTGYLNTYQIIKLVEGEFVNTILLANGECLYSKDPISVLMVLLNIN